jgi:hypothetical protein
MVVGRTTSLENGPSSCDADGQGVPMGILCDLFVSTKEDALVYESTFESEQHGRFSPAEFKGFTSLEFGTLWAILTNEEWDVHKHRLLDVDFGSDHESWLCEFPEEYVQVLSRTDSDAIKRAAQAWSETEELSCSAEDVRPVIDTLVQLSRRALSRNEGLYMWGSL